MMFEGDEDNFICDYCGDEYPSDFLAGYDESPVCKICAHKLYVAWTKEPCVFCGEPMGSDASDPYFNSATEQSAHGICYHKHEEDMTPDELDEWLRCQDN